MRQPVFTALARGDHDNRQVGARPHLAGQGQPVFVRQAEVQQDQVDCLAVHDRQHFLAGAGVADLEIFRLQIGGQQGLDELVVFDDQQMFLHA